MVRLWVRVSARVATAEPARGGEQHGGGDGACQQAVDVHSEGHTPPLHILGQGARGGGSVDLGPIVEDVQWGEGGVGGGMVPLEP